MAESPLRWKQTRYKAAIVRRFEMGRRWALGITWTRASLGPGFERRNFRMMTILATVCLLTLVSAALVLPKRAEAKAARKAR
ncbi:hypothetical protein GCM10017056_06430 [Seohaeicola zhoushanensis]|uniref:Uncharacterized protein n=1 Tax=Seohaeicola zhoushanensis TaxID=1569283 RepID=A0A8J3GUN0_9RHOB|nr:hypothetical protein GCM10017056_06430 [Seohaeicola zhoushanensis]